MRISDWSSYVCSSDLPTAGDEPLDTDYENLYTNGAAGEGPGSEPAFSTRSGAAAGDDGEHSLEQRLSDTVSLRQHLTEQLHIETADPTDRAIGACLIDQLDDNGYLSGDLPALAKQLGRATSRERVCQYV